MEEKRFQKKEETFICLNCRKVVKGDGYTDHCPECLYSRHVDKNPGDRKENCKGLMEPVGLEVRGGKKIIHYTCKRCNLKHRVKVAKEDSEEEILKLSKLVYE